MAFNYISAAEAASLIKHGYNIGLSGFTPAGTAKAVTAELAKIAEAENCGRFEWAVLDWNTPSIEFYKSLGAKPMDEWTVFRLDKKGISDLAGK